MGKKGLEDLQVWLRAKDLAVVVCKEAVPRFPLEEKYCLGLQLRRAVQSVPANIAEAYGDIILEMQVVFATLPEDH